VIIDYHPPIEFFTVRRRRVTNALPMRVHACTGSGTRGTTDSYLAANDREHEPMLFIYFKERVRVFNYLMMKSSFSNFRLIDRTRLNRT